MKTFTFALVCFAILLSPAVPAFCSPDEGIYLEADSAAELSVAYNLTKEDAGIYLEAPGLKEAIAADVFDTHTLAAGEHLWHVASLRTVYGDPEMYPLLVDANPEYFAASADMREGMKIRIPRNLSAEMVAQAREAAWTPAYAGLIGLKFSRDQYVQFRLQMDQKYWLAKSMANKIAMK